jgi:hypothetical protein
MKGEIPMVSGDEQDALGGWRKYLKFRPGIRKRIKRSFRKRVRKFVKGLLRKEDV